MEDVFKCSSPGSSLSLIINNADGSASRRRLCSTEYNQQQSAAESIVGNQVSEVSVCENQI